MEDLLKILILEDLPSDAELARREIKKEFKQVTFEVVEKKEDYIRSLKNFKPDVIISDYKMPVYDGMKALKLRNKMYPMIPFIILTGSQNEDTAVKCLKAGADDYVIKEHIKRLDQAVKNAIKKKTLELEKKITAEEIINSSRILRNSQRIAKIGSWQLEIGSDTAYWSKEIFDMYGRSSDDKVPNAVEWQELIHPDDWEKLVSHVKKAIKGKCEYNIEYRIIRADTGEYRYIHSLAELIYENDIPVKLDGIDQDITDRRLTEIDLVKTLSLQQATLESTADGILVVDLQGRIIDYNKQFLNIWGLSPDVLQNGDEKDLVSPENTEYAMNHIIGQLVDPEKFIAIVQDLYSKPDNESFDVLEFKNGKVVERISKPQYIDDKPVGRVWCFRDVTDRKKAEQTLKENEQQLRNIFENSTNLFYSHDVNHKLTYISPQVEKILGYTVEEAMINWTDFVSENPINEIGFQNTIKAIETGKRQPTYELELVRRDGKKIMVEVRESPIVENGETVAIVGSLADITERKEAQIQLQNSEEKYRSIVEGSIQGMVIAQADPIRLSFASQPMEKIAGYSVAELMTFKDEKLLNLIHSDDRQRFFEAFQNRIVGKNISQSAEYKIIHKDSSIRWVELYSSLITIDNEPAIQSAFLDITDRKQAEEKLKDSEEKYRSIFENSALGIFRSTPEGRYEEVNRAFADILGFKSPEKMIDKVDDINKLYKFPKDRKKIVKEFAEKGFVENYEIVANHSRKEKVWISINAKQQKHPDEHIYYEGTVQDITDRKLAEEALKENEKKFRSYVENAPVGIFITDEKGKYVDVNPEACKITGYSKEELLTLKIPDLLPEDDLENKMKNFRELSKVGSIHFEKSFITKSGEIRYWEISAVKLSENRFLGFTKDITQTMRFEQELIKLSTAVTQSPSEIVITDKNGLIEYVNPKFTEISGYTLEEIKGKTPRILKSGELPKEVYDELWMKITSGEEWRGEFHNKKKNGTFFWEMASITPIINDKGETINYLKVAEDITEVKKSNEALRQSEEKYRTLVSSTAEGFWMINSKNVTIDVNTALCKMLEYDEENLIGMSIYEFVDKENAKIFHKQVKDATTKKQRSYEIVLTSKTGKKIPAIFNATTQFNKEGKRIGSFAFITNISKLKEAEKEISNRLAEKTVLIQEIYHRTKNNMAVISAMLSMESNRTDDIFLKTIFKEMINKIRAMALVHQKLYEVKDLSNIKLNEYIKDLMGLLMRSYYPLSKAVEVSFDMKEVKILIDTAVPLGMVINELVSNIFKHAYPENKKGTISIRLFRDEANWINLELTDSGVGFPEDFDPRKDSSMGLSSVFSVVEHQLRGEISVESKNGLAWKIKLRDDVHKKRV